MRRKGVRQRVPPFREADLARVCPDQRTTDAVRELIADRAPCWRSARLKRSSEIREQPANRWSPISDGVDQTSVERLRRGVEPVGDELEPRDLSRL
jgi:hypothetical protein